ncbi:hypothetical protein BH09BAC1_BH09BAC1_12510 [soil metagenome]
MKTYLLLLPALLLMASCAMYHPLTEKDRTENKWTESELKQVQFYLSSDIVRQRKVGNETSSITNGKVRIVNGERIEEVIIKKGTPGILTSSKDGSLAVSFENGDDKYLMFGANKGKGGRYYLLASDWKNDIGKVHYENQVYFCTPESGKAFLTLDLKKLHQIDVDKRTAKGRKL